MGLKIDGEQLQKARDIAAAQDAPAPADENIATGSEILKKTEGAPAEQATPSDADPIDSILSGVYGGEGSAVAPAGDAPTPPAEPTLSAAEQRIAVLEASIQQLVQHVMQPAAQPAERAQPTANIPGMPDLSHYPEEIQQAIRNNYTQTAAMQEQMRRWQQEQLQAQEAQTQQRLEAAVESAVRKHPGADEDAVWGRLLRSHSQIKSEADVYEVARRIAEERKTRDRGLLSDLVQQMKLGAKQVRAIPDAPKVADPAAPRPKLGSEEIIKQGVELLNDIRKE